MTLPTGERLPGYEDEPQVDAFALRAWLVEHCPNRWGESTLIGKLPPDALEASAEYERVIITDVIGALLTVGRATIVKNATYRALERDRLAVETLGAGLARLGLNQQVIEADGDPVKAAVQVIDDLARTVREMAR